MDANAAEYHRWYAQAEHDLAAATASSSAGHFEWACFQAQQGAEKALKAFLFLTGRRAIISHSVAALLRECEAIDPTFSAARRSKELDQYYIPTRYPNGLPGQIPHEFFSIEDATKCIDHAVLTLRCVSEAARRLTA